MSKDAESASSVVPLYPNASLSNPPPLHTYRGNGLDIEEAVCIDCNHHSGQWWHQTVRVQPRPNEALQEIHGFCTAIVSGENYSTGAHDIAQVILDIIGRSERRSA